MVRGRPHRTAGCLPKLSRNGCGSEDAVDCFNLKQVLRTGPPPPSAGRAFFAREPRGGNGPRLAMQRVSLTKGDPS
jgi:hypothetical protein